MVLFARVGFLGVITLLRIKNLAGVIYKYMFKMILIGARPDGLLSNAFLMSLGRAAPINLLGAGWQCSTGRAHPGPGSSTSSSLVSGVGGEIAGRIQEMGDGDEGRTGERMQGKGKGNGRTN